jgi:glyoxylase-like metal-dependent hydrolase (beta-lactamase superfamily II)
MIAGVAAVLLLSGWGLWLVMTGSLPLEDGAQIADGAITIVKDESALMPVAAHLFRLQDGGYGLIDAALDAEATNIRAALERLGRTSDDIRVILFTHGHGDHTRGARAFPNAETYGLVPDSELANRPSLWNRIRNFFGNEQEPADAEEDGVKHRVADGDILDLHGTRIEVFALPGHTADSAAYLVYGVLFFGDSAAAAHDGTFVAAPPIFSIDRARNRLELRALAERLHPRRSEIKHLAFGHQGPLQGLDPLLEWAGLE